MGDSFIYYGPPKDDNTTTVYIGGWLRLPTDAIGFFECIGYDRSASVTVLPRSKVALLPNTDKDFVAPYAFRCLPATGEEQLYEATPRNERTLEIRWWLHGGHLASVTWNSSANIVGGDVRQSTPLNSEEPYFIDPVGGDLFIFDRETVRRMSCLRCTRRGTRYTTTSLLSCRLPETDPTFHGSNKSLPYYADQEEFSHRVILVITWIIASIAVVAVVGVMFVNGIALYQGCSWSSMCRGSIGASYDRQEYKKLGETG